MMKLKKNTQAGRVNFLVILIYFIFIDLAFSITKLEIYENLEGDFIEVKVLDKVSSKSSLLKLKIGEEKKI